MAKKYIDGNGVQTLVDKVKSMIPTTLPAQGGNADTVDSYHIVVGSSAGTAKNTIYIVT